MGLQVDSMTSQLDSVLPGVRVDLERLIRIPSVSAAGFDPAELERSAELTAEVFHRSGLPLVEILEVQGSHPAVYGSSPAPRGAPTVLLYAHHDVQPPGDPSDWASPPFEPVERDGRLYGRGSADDKGAIAVHAAALRAHSGTPPVGVTVLIEGEEETGSAHLCALLERFPDLLRADVIVVADGDNWNPEQPTLTTSLRGLVDCIVEVRTLEHAVHSGMYGGVFPDALTALVRLLGSMHDEDGRVAVPGLVSTASESDGIIPDEIRQARPLFGVELIGTGSVAERMTHAPAISTVAIDAPSVAKTTNQLVPAARAKVSLRLAPGDDPSRAFAALEVHLRDHIPWGASLDITPGACVAPFEVAPTGPAYDAAADAFEAAWNAPLVTMGSGVTIPFAGTLASAYPEAAILMTGVADADCRAHGSNEGLHLVLFRKACLAETYLLARLGEARPPGAAGLRRGKEST